MSTSAQSFKRPSPSQVREQVLSQHQGLRRLLGQAIHVKPDDVEKVAQELRRNFLYHLAFEEAFLFPALGEADIWGPERLEAVTAEHAQQRADLDGILALVRAQRSSDDIAGALKALAAALLADMDEEEAELLDPDLLRDDVVAIDQTTD